MNYIAIVTLCDDNAEAFYYVLLPPACLEKGVFAEKRLMEGCRAANREQLRAQVISCVGCPDFSEQKVLYTGEDNTVIQYHYTGTKRLFRTCLPNASGIDENVKYYTFYDVDKLPTFSDAIFKNCFIKIEQGFLSKIRVPGYGAFGRFDDWASDTEEDTADDSLIRSCNWGFILNSGVSGDFRQKLSDKLLNHNRRFLILDKKDGKYTSKAGVQYNVVFDLGLFSVVVRDKLLLSANDNLVNAIEDKENIFNANGSLNRKPFFDRKNSAIKPKMRQQGKRFIVTSKQISSVRKKKKIVNKRLVTQSSCFNNVSANQAVQKIVKTFSDKVDSSLPYEYSHLIYHGAAGEWSQTKDNLVLTTKYCNTLMLAVENKITKLALQGHKISLKVEAFINAEETLTNDYNVAEKIIYRLIIDDLPPVTFTFDPKTPIKPPKGIQKIVSELMDIVLYSDADLADISLVNPCRVPTAIAL